VPHVHDHYRKRDSVVCGLRLDSETLYDDMERFISALA